MNKLSLVTFREGNLHLKTVGDVRWNCNGEFLASASFDKTTKIGQLDNSGNLRPLQTIQRSGNITQTLWHPTDTNIISLLGEEKVVEIWDVRANRTISKINSLGNNINASWSPNGDYIAIGNKSDHLTILDSRSSRQLKKLKFNYEINELSWSYHSNHILIATGGSEMGGVDVVSFDGTDLVQISPTISAHTSNCYCLKVDPTYTRMAVGSADFLVSLWDLTDLTCHHTVQSFDSPIRCLAYSSDGEKLAAAAEGNTLYICNSYNGEIETTVDCRGALMALSWHPKYDLIAIAPDINSGEEESGRHRGQLDKFVRLLSFSNTSQ